MEFDWEVEAEDLDNEFTLQEIEEYLYYEEQPLMAILHFFIINYLFY